MTMFAEACKSKAVRWIGIGWSAFIVENVVLSHNREWIRETYGDDNYHTLYNTLSTVACSSIAWGYLKHGRGMGPLLNPRSKPLLLAGSIVQIIGLVGLSQVPPKFQIPVTLVPSGSQSNTEDTAKSGQSSANTFSSKLQVRCPMDFKAKDIPPNTVYGMERVSRHAIFWSFGLTCAGYAMTTVFIPEVVMFSFPLIFAYIGSEHQDYRFRRGSGGTLTAEHEKKTSNIPFAAFIRGEQSFSDLAKEMKWLNAAMAVTIGMGFLLRRVIR